ncbi:MAG: hypothetical protein ABJI44_07765 [Marinomonas sp.]
MTGPNFKFLVCIFLPIFLIACGEKREENSEFFEKKTGLRICQEAEIRNVKIGEYDYRTDFTYGVEISASEKCEAEFRKEIKNRLNVDCSTLERCSFWDENNWTYRISRTEEGKLLFVLGAV